MNQVLIMCGIINLMFYKLFNYLIFLFTQIPCVCEGKCCRQNVCVFFQEESLSTFHTEGQLGRFETMSVDNSNSTPSDCGVIHSFIFVFYLFI